MEWVPKSSDRYDITGSDKLIALATCRYPGVELVDAIYIMLPLIKSGRGDTKASPLCLQMHVSYRLDTQIPIQHLGRWGRRVPKDQDGRGTKDAPRNRVSGAKYPIRPRAYRDQFSAQVQYCESGPDHQTEHGAGVVVGGNRKGAKSGKGGVGGKTAKTDLSLFYPTRGATSGSC